VRELVADLMGEAAQATVSKRIREIVQACDELGDHGAAAVSVTGLAKRLGIDKSVASTRYRAAACLGYLVNHEGKKGRPARIVLGDALPEERQLLPTREELEEVLRCFRGGTYTPLPRADFLMQSRRWTALHSRVVAASPKPIEKSVVLSGASDEISLGHGPEVPIMHLVLRRTRNNANLHLRAFHSAHRVSHSVFGDGARRPDGASRALANALRRPPHLRVGAPPHRTRFVLQIVGPLRMRRLHPPVDEATVAARGVASGGRRPHRSRTIWMS